MSCIWMVLKYVNVGVKHFKGVLGCQKYAWNDLTESMEIM